MSNDVRAVTGAKTPIKLNGREFLASQVTQRMIGEIQGLILAKRLNVFKQVGDNLKNVPPEHHKTVLEAAVRHCGDPAGVSPDDLRNFMASPEGQAACLWLMVRPDAPDVTREQVEDWTANMLPDEIAATFELASGMAAVKNSSGTAAK